MTSAGFDANATPHSPHCGAHPPSRAAVSAVNPAAAPLRWLAAGLCSWALALSSGNSLAQNGEDAALDRVASYAQKQLGGKIVNIQPIEDSDPPAYSVRVLQRSGKVVTLRVDTDDLKQDTNNGKP